MAPKKNDSARAKDKRRPQEPVLYCEVRHSRCPPARHLTVKLRGRVEAPAVGAEGAQFLSARGANTEAPHGPLQRLLEGTRVTFETTHAQA